MYPRLSVEVIDDLVASGGVSWWIRDDFFVANDNAWDVPELSGDVYVLDASEAWLSQFEGDWQACADQVNPLLAQYDE